MNMRLVKRVRGYDVYVGYVLGVPLWNAVPHGAPIPQGGYLNRDYVERVIIPMV